MNDFFLLSRLAPLLFKPFVWRNTALWSSSNWENDLPYSSSPRACSWRALRACVACTPCS